LKRSNLTRKDLAKTIHEKMGFSQRGSRQIVDVFFDAMRDALIREDPVKIVQFGTFSVRHKEPRVGRNPRTGETMEIAKRSMISFRPSKKLRERLNPE